MHQPKVDFNQKKKIHQPKLDMQQRIKNSPKERKKNRQRVFTYLCRQNIYSMEERKTNIL